MLENIADLCIGCIPISHRFWHNIYRPQHSFSKVMSVILSMGRCLPQCMLGYTPLARHPPSSACWETHLLPSACWDTHPLPECILGCTPPPACLVHAGIHMATAADGTHPTGMHSCHIMKIYSSGGSRISPR